MNMKRLLAFITMLAVVLPGAVFAEAPENAADSAAVEYSSNVKEAVALMEYLDVLKTDNDDDNQVSRADFAVYTARLMKIDEYAKTSEDRAYYYDVPFSHWAAASVNNLTELGVLNVDSEKMFHPDDIITLEEATKMMLAVLGYRGYAETRGGYPAGYMTVARQLRLHEGMSDSENLTKIDAIVLLANAANTVVMNMLPYKGKSLYKKSGESFLNIYRGMYAAEGRLETVNETSIYPDGALDDAVMIDGVVYDYNGHVDFIGRRVKAYYTEPTDGDKTIAFILDETKAGDVLEISADNLAGFDDNYNLTYYDKGGKKRTVSIEKNAAVVYNGICAGTNVAGLVNGTDEGTVTALRSSGGAYDTLIVCHSETVVVGHIDIDAKRFYDSANPEKVYDISDNNIAAIIYGESGNEMNLSAIGKDSVLSVFENPEKRIEVWISNSTVEGVYMGEGTVDGKRYINIDDSRYEVDEKYYPIFKNQLVMSQNMTFLLNMYGKVAGISDAVGSNNYNFGYYMVHNSVKAGFDNRVIMRLYTQSEGIKAFTLAERVVIDGKSYRNDSILSAWETALANSQAELDKFPGKPSGVRTRAIRYKLNEAGEIIDIDTPYHGENESDNTLRITAVNDDSDYIWIGIIGKSITFNQNTVMFKVPNEELIKSATDKMFSSSVGVKSFKNKTGVIAYKTSVESGVSDLIVNIAEITNTFAASDHIMFDSIVTSADKDGFAVDVLTGWKAGAKVEYVISSDVVNEQNQPVKIQDADIEKGDMLIYTLDASNEVSAYCKIYDWRDEQTYPTPTDKVFTKDGHDFYGRRMTFGYAKHKYTDGIIDISYTKGGSVEEAYPANNITITVFDREARKNNIYKGSISDVAAFDDAGADCSVMIVYAEYAVWQSCYIYK